MGNDFEPDSRYLQANERTLLAWMRTGLALAGFGFVVAKSGSFLEAAGIEGRPSMVYVGWGVALLVTGAGCEIASVFRFLAVRRALLRGTPIPNGAIFPAVVAFAMAAFSVVLAVQLLIH